ncbi:hypothetical protein FACS18949_15080 [Clostridia bacterium]|nr:hypothetical protein FACS18949_15080 [Clostridia bacterium]
MYNTKFEKGMVYENVYLVFIDASGHSSIVKDNPKDVATQAFDLLFDSISTRLSRTTQKHRCQIAVIWSWLGDGGLIAIHDSEETKSISTTMEFVKETLQLDLPNLQREFTNDSITGELHIRIAVHKGTIKYTDEGQQGFIHSSDINWGAHLEKATPRDSVSISKDVFSVLRHDLTTHFIDVGDFEGRQVYVYSPGITNQITIPRIWRSLHGFQHAENVQAYLERISQKDKAALIDSAVEKVIDFGTTLNTCSNYLFSTERPIPYRDAVMRLLERGGSFICYMLMPNSSGSRQLIELRREDTNQKLCTSIERFRRFKERNLSLSDNFKVYQYDENPNFAAMIIDPDSDDAVCLYSPYLNFPLEGEAKGRADMPHYLVSKRAHAAYDYVLNFLNTFISNAREVL